MKVLERIKVTLKKKEKDKPTKKKKVSKALLKEKVIHLNPWDPMGTLAE